MSLIVVTLTNLLELTSQEVKAYTLLEKLNAKSDIQVEASCMIGTVAKLKNAKKENKSGKSNRLVQKLENQLEDQRK